jgi:hypothetical protein
MGAAEDGEATGVEAQWDRDIFLSSRYCKSLNTPTPVELPFRPSQLIAVGVLNLLPVPKRAEPLATVLCGPENRITGAIGENAGSRKVQLVHASCL